MSNPEIWLGDPVDREFMLDYVRRIIETDRFHDGSIKWIWHAHFSVKFDNLRWFYI